MIEFADGKGSAVGAPKESNEDLNALAFRAAAGDRYALEHVCLAVQDPVYRLALRFFSSPEDAEDCTQEIRIQVIPTSAASRGGASSRPGSTPSRPGISSGPAIRPNRRSFTAPEYRLALQDRFLVWQAVAGLRA